MANNNLKPKEARFGQMFFSTNFAIGDCSEFDIFNITESQGKIIYHTSEIRTSPIRKVKKMADDLILLTTDDSYYVCYQGHSIDEKYIFATIGEIPTKGKEIEIIGYNEGTEYKGVYYSNVTPERVNDKFAEYNMYIFDAKGKEYLCYLR